MKIKITARVTAGHNKFFFSLGENALALVMSINLVNGPNDQAPIPAPAELVISAINSTSSILVQTPYFRRVLVIFSNQYC